MENPFDSFSSPFGETTKEAVKKPQKAGPVQEAKDLLDAAITLESQARLARKTKNWNWLKKLEGIARKILNILWDFTKKAMMLAVFNFIVDLCTMILGSVSKSLTEQKSSIGSIPVQQAAHYNDPFSRHYGNTTVGW